MELQKGQPKVDQIVKKKKIIENAFYLMYSPKLLLLLFCGSFFI